MKMLALSLPFILLNSLSLSARAHDLGKNKTFVFVSSTTTHENTFDKETGKVIKATHYPNKTEDDIIYQTTGAVQFDYEPRSLVIHVTGGQPLRKTTDNGVVSYAHNSFSATTVVDSFEGFGELHTGSSVFFITFKSKQRAALIKKLLEGNQNFEVRFVKHCYFRNAQPDCNVSNTVVWDEKNVVIKYGVSRGYVKLSDALDEIAFDSLRFVGP